MKPLKIFLIVCCLHSGVAAGEEASDLHAPLDENPYWAHGMVDTTSNEDPPLLKQRKEAHTKYMARVEEKMALMGDLERLAVNSDLMSPRYTDALPYRNSKTDSLEQMLSDVELAKNWGAIAVTIGMVADKNAARRLVDFIKSDNTRENHAEEADDARVAGIVGLRYYLEGSRDPEIMSFLVSLLDEKNIRNLKISKSVSLVRIRSVAESGLSFIASNESIQALENLRNKAQATSDKTIQNLASKEAVRDKNYVKRLDKIIAEAKRKRGGAAEDWVIEDAP